MAETPARTRKPRTPCKKCGFLSCQCLEILLLKQIAEAGLPPPIREYLFAAPARKWRADFAYVEPIKLIIEVEGGGQFGRHSTVAGARGDMIKYNTISSMGFKHLRFDGRLINIGIAIKQIEAVFAGGFYVPPASMPLTRAVKKERAK